MPDSTIKVFELGAAVIVAVLVSFVRALVISHRSWMTALVGFAVGVMLGVTAAMVASLYQAGPGVVATVAAICALGGRDLAMAIIDEFKAFREDREAFVRRWLPWIRGGH